MSKIDWMEQRDRHSNTLWVGAAPYTDEGGSPEFYWKIKRKLRGDKIVYVLRSDFELLAEGDRGREFKTPKAAQKYCQEQHNQIIEEILKERKEGKLEVCED